MCLVGRGYLDQLAPQQGVAVGVREGEDAGFLAGDEDRELVGGHRRLLDPDPASAGDRIGDLDSHVVRALGVRHLRDDVARFGHQAADEDGLVVFAFRKIRQEQVMPQGGCWSLCIHDVRS